jgi:ABC-type sugar transport system permease subunit
LEERAPRCSLPTSITRQTTERRRRRLGAAWLAALAIPFAFLLFASVGPVVDQAFGSFFNWYDIHPKSFAGFHYYREVLADPMASAALVHTAIYVGITVPVEVVLGALRAPARYPLVVDGNAVFRRPQRYERG